jgi:hypothetical protein
MIKLKSLLNEKQDWDQNLSRISSEINKVFGYAKIKVLKHIPYKRAHRRGDAAVYGAFIYVKDNAGAKTVLPIEVDKNGIIRYAGGPSGWHKLEKIGAINMKQGRDNLKIKSYARTADYLKQFAKMPGFGQDVIRKKKESVDEKINKDDKIQVRGVGMYTYATLKSTLQDKAKDLFKQAKGEKWSRVSRGGLRAMAEMWDAMAKYDRTH